MPVISVIIPAYNVETYLGKCLESAVSQSFRDIEIIVVNDGSTDSTLEIAARYSELDSRIRLFSKPNGGPSDARNFGIEKSQGEYLCFLDGDDCLYRDSLEILLDGVRSTGCRLSVGSFSRKSEMSISHGGGHRWHIAGKTQAIEEMLYQKSIVPAPWGKLYDRHIFDNMRFRKGITYEDLDIIYRLSDEVDNVAVTDAQVYFYRPNDMSLTTVFSPKRFDVLDVTRRIESYMAVHHPSLLPAARDRRLSANFNMLGLIAVHDIDGKYAAVADSCWALIKEYRKASLTNPDVRFKNKLGILVSYAGRSIFELISRFIYR